MQNLRTIGVEVKMEKSGLTPPMPFSLIPGLGPNHGVVAVSQSDTSHASANYTPALNFEGKDAFDVTVENCGFSTEFPSEVIIYVVAGPTLSGRCDPIGDVVGIRLDWQLDEAVLNMIKNEGLTIRDYKVYRSDISGGPYTLLQTLNDPNASSYVDTAVVDGQTYYYIVTFEHQDPNSGAVYESPLSNEIAAKAGRPNASIKFDSFWHVTDITDPDHPIDRGDRQAPFASPLDYNLNPLPPAHTYWTDCNTWSNHITLDLTGYTAEQRAKVAYSIAVDNDFWLYVNNQLVRSYNGAAAYWLPLEALPNLISGVNEIGVVISGDCDDLNYFSMVVSGDTCGE